MRRDVVDLDSIDRTSMACPAMPTCGLAVTESERSLPDINTRIRTLMSALGFDEAESFVVRMTGARPLALIDAFCSSMLDACKSSNCWSVHTSNGVREVVFSVPVPV